MDPQPIEIEVDFDVPFASGAVTYTSYVKAAAVCDTANLLRGYGNYIPESPVDTKYATTEIGKSITNPEYASGLDSLDMSISTAEAIKTVLGAYNYDLLRHASQMRNMVISKLVERVDSPRDGMRALELLGKIPEVGLFTDRVVIPSNNNPEEIKSRLRERLNRVINKNTVNSAAQDVDVKSEIDTLKQRLKPNA